MAEFKKILEEIEAVTQTLHEVGGKIIEKYPQSKNLIELVGDLNIAVEGLKALKEKLAVSLAEAEQDTALKEDLKLQLSEKPLYQGLEEDEKRLLAEWLVQNKQGLATEEDLKNFIQEKFAEKDAKTILGEFNKPYIIKLGQQLFENADEFEAYAEGVKYLKERLESPEGKTEIIDRIGDEYLKTMPHRLIHLYYEDAFV